MGGFFSKKKLFTIASMAAFTMLMFYFKRMQNIRDIRAVRFFYPTPIPINTKEDNLVSLVAEWVEKTDFHHLGYIDEAGKLKIDENLQHFSKFISHVGKAIVNAAKVYAQCFPEKTIAIINGTFYNDLSPVEQAKKLRNELLETMKINPENIFITIVRIYTDETFLYKSINAALRNHDLKECDTLSPYCYLLNLFFIFNCQMYDNIWKPKYAFKGIVYHKTNLTKKDLKIYDLLLNIDNVNTLESEGFISSRPYFIWDAFVSTMNNKLEALQVIGNTLFIISIPEESNRDDSKPCYAVNVSQISKMNEQEIILPAGTMLKILKVKKSKKLYKKIYLELQCRYNSNSNMIKDRKMPFVF